MPDEAPKYPTWPLRKRVDGLRKWLRREHPEVDEMKHLDDGTPERAYWHYGYMMAFRDILTLAGSPSGKPRLLEEIAAVPIQTEDWWTDVPAGGDD